MRIKWVVWACFLVVGIAASIVPSVSAQDTSTPEEQAQWVTITHKLENNPLDDSMDKQGTAALNQISNAHDIHVPLCPALLGGFSGMKYAYAHTIARQYMLASQHGVPDRESRQSERPQCNESGSRGKRAQGVYCDSSTEARQQS
jgi:hypothetical protein